MKILYFDDFRLGVLRGDEVVDVSALVQDFSHTGPHDLINGLIERFDDYRGALEKATADGAGTPLANAESIDPFEFVRTIAAARITMPTSLVRLSAGRQEMSDELQALCFLAGANSIFYGDKLLTTGNPEAGRDERLFERLGLRSA